MKIETPIISSRLILKELIETDAEGSYKSWVKDPLVNKFLEFRHAIPTIEELKKFISTMNLADDSLLLGIFLASGEHIGNIKLGPIDWEAREATLGLMLGDKDQWGKGYASEAIESITEFSFSHLRLSGVNASCYLENVASHKAFLKAGYQEQGREKRCWKGESGAVDVIYFKKSPKLLRLDINKIDLNKRGVSDFYWPISSYEISKIYASLLKDVVSSLREAKSKSIPGVDAGIILNIFFVQEVMSVYQTELMISRAEKVSYTIEPSKRNRLMTAFLAKEIPAASAFICRLRKGPPALKRWRAPLRFLRDIVVGYKEGMSRRPLFPVNYQTRTISTTVDYLATTSAKSLKEKVIYKRPNTWFSGLNVRGCVFNEKNSEIINILMQLVDQNLSSTEISLSVEAGVYLRKWLEESVTLVEGYTDALEKQENKIPTTLWVNAAGNIWGRILARYLQNHGGHVTRYDHGCGCGYFSTSRGHGAFDFEDCNTFVSFSKNQAMAFKEAFTGSETVQSKCPKMRTINSGEYFKRHLKSAPDVNNRFNSPQTIMYIASVYPGEHVYPAEKGFMSDIVLLDWETRVISQLSDWNYKVILKPHPAEVICVDAPLAIKKLFGPIVTNEPFEKVFHQADVIILDDPCSTLLATLILSDKAFIYLDFGIEEFSDEARALLERRCLILKGWYDDNNRACLDWGSLHEGIENCREYRDQQFAEKYLLN